MQQSKGKASGVSWRDLEHAIRRFAEHFRRVHRFDPGRRHLKLAVAVQAQRVFQLERPRGTYS
jgi:hypothetical protein